MNQDPRTLLHRATPERVPPLDHGRLQRHGRRRRRVRRAAEAGGLAGLVVAAVIVVTPLAGGLPAWSPLGGGQAVQPAEAAASWPQGQAGEIDWWLLPAEEAAVDDPAADPGRHGCSLWLAHEVAGGHRGGDAVCPPGRWEVEVQRLTVADADGSDMADLLVVMAGDRRSSLRLELFGGERRHPELLDLGALDGGPPVSLGVVPVAPGTGIEHFGG